MQPVKLISVPACAQRHWDDVYESKDSRAVSWFEGTPAHSLELIEATGVRPDAAIIDVGGGASRLARELVRRGYSDVTVADISPHALAVARSDLGPDAEGVKWETADVRDHGFGRRFHLWHDRAVFHFMVSASDRDAYLDTLLHSVEPGGSVILATFGPEGPTSCSGLPTARYGAEELSRVLGSSFELHGSRTVEHKTPSGNGQQFLYAHLRRCA